MNLGELGVQIGFPSPRFEEEAHRHICLSETFTNRVIGLIDYIEDDSVSGLIRSPCKPNVVYIEKHPIEDGHDRTILRMFDRYTISLDIRERRIAVRYPSKAPVSLMLDDVLQAALQPIMESVGGFILHGSCMALAENAIVFMGNSGSGKSTTAFNLTRFGFRCYADDAVLVTPVGDRLWAWPLSRELSIRPLSFMFFRKQGVRLNGYRKDGEKYYFASTANAGEGAILKHICFLETSGENESTILRLDPEQTLGILLREKRHFSFMGRSSAESYSRVLAAKVPQPLLARVGIDLEAQGKAFDCLMRGAAPVSPAGRTADAIDVQGRKAKMALIREAWTNPGREPLEKLIPLLGDFDLKVFTAVLAFFQNYALAHLEAVTPPHVESNISHLKARASWLRTEGWLAGIEALVSQSSKEVFERFATAWFKSAPLLYPFMRMVARAHPELDVTIESGWTRCREGSHGETQDMPGVAIHVTDLDAASVFSKRDVCSIWDAALSSHEIAPQQVRLRYWLSASDPSGWHAMIDFLTRLDTPPAVTLIPVDGIAESPLDVGIGCIRSAWNRGVKAQLSRLTPLCRIREGDANALLSANQMERCIDPRVRQRYLLQEGGDIGDWVDFSPGSTLTWEQARIRWTEKPLAACSACCLYPAGLCRGGYTKQLP